MAKRVIIVDFNHMAHTYMNSQHRLSVTTMVNGRPAQKDTTVQSGTIKQIFRWSNKGSFPTAVCFDSPVPARKGYFAKAFEMKEGTDGAYKGGRTHMPSDMFEAIGDVKNILVSAGVSCYKGENYEADDLIFACIQVAKEAYPGVPIDVITNDADLLPLVDDVVSVFLRSRVNTYAETPDLEKLHYIQVTPKNYQSVVQNLSAYRKFSIPYNTLLLHKLLRGDSSDNIGVKEISKMFPPKKYNELIQTLTDKGIDLTELCRYGECPKRYISKSTGETVEDIESWDRNDLALTYDDPEELTKLVEVLCWYVEPEVIEHIKKMYRGMNLNQAYLSLGEKSRKPAKLKEPMKPFSDILLQKKVSGLNIRLPM